MPRPAPRTVVLDAGALIALSRDAPRARSFIDAAVGDGAPMFLSGVTLAEVVRGAGPRDAIVNRTLRYADVIPVTEAMGRHAGRLLAIAGSRDTIDAVVVATAQQIPGGTVVLTSDPADICRLAKEASDVSVITV